MAQKKIDIKFNIDDKSVKIAGEETMKLSQQVRLLKAELASGKYSQEEFQVLATKLGDVEDQMAKTKVRSGDLFTSLQHRLEPENPILTLVFESTTGFAYSGRDARGLAASYEVSRSADG